MADLSALLEQAINPTRPPCKYQRILQDVSGTLTDQQMADLEGLPAATAANILTQAGHPVSDDVIRRHRKHQCG